MLGEPDPSRVNQAAPQLIVIPVEALRPNPRQPRSVIPSEALAELTASVAARGILQPLLVRPAAEHSGHFEIVAGERRWRAAKAAGLAAVPCIMQPLPDEAAALAALVENLQREDLGALDEAEGYRLVLERFGLTQETLAQAVGKSRSHVANTIRLLDLPESVRTALLERKISPGHARALLAHANPEHALATVIDGDLTVRATEALATESPRTMGGADHRARDRETPGRSRPTVVEAKAIDATAVERTLSDSLGLVVELHDRRGRGRLVIKYRTLDQLEGLVRLLAPGDQ